MNPVKESMMDEYLKKHPYLKETAKLYLGMEKILSEQVAPVSLPEPQELAGLVRDGLPLLQQAQLQQTVVKVAAVELSDVLAAMKALEAPAPMKTALQDWKIWADEAELSEIQQCFGWLLRQEDTEIHAFAEAARLNEALVRFLGWQIIRALLPDGIKVPEIWAQADWSRPYCPVCGRPPVLAQLRRQQEGHARYLVCDGCHTMWRAARVGCVYCGNQDLKTIHILEAEEEPAMRLDVCDRCHVYLKTCREEGGEEIYLRDWATIHLDLLGEEKGLHKKGSIMLANS